MYIILLFYPIYFLQPWEYNSILIFFKKYQRVNPIEEIDVAPIVPLNVSPAFKLMNKELKNLKMN